MVGVFIQIMRVNHESVQSVFVWGFICVSRIQRYEKRSALAQVNFVWDIEAAQRKRYTFSSWMQEGEVSGWRAMVRGSVFQFGIDHGGLAAERGRVQCQ